MERISQGDEPGNAVGSEGGTGKILLEPVLEFSTASKQVLRGVSEPRDVVLFEDHVELGLGKA